MSGKSTVISLLKDTLPKDTIFIPDRFWAVYESLRGNGIFDEFTEITKDRDYLFMYISKVVEDYNSILEEYEDYNGVVVLENCYIDYVIYMTLNLWYHYPLVQFQEYLTLKLLESRDKIERIYMTTPDDHSYPPPKKLDIKNSKTAFTRNRGLELALYDTYREVGKVVTLDPCVFAEDRTILEDLKAQGIIL